MFRKKDYEHDFEGFDLQIILFDSEDIITTSPPSDGDDDEEEIDW